MLFDKCKSEKDFDNILNIKTSKLRCAIYLKLVNSLVVRNEWLRTNSSMSVKQALCVNPNDMHRLHGVNVIQNVIL